MIIIHRSTIMMMLNKKMSIVFLHTCGRQLTIDRCWRVKLPRLKVTSIDLLGSVMRLKTCLLISHFRHVQNINAAFLKGVCVGGGVWKTYKPNMSALLWRSPYKKIKKFNVLSKRYCFMHFLLFLSGSPAGSVVCDGRNVIRYPPSRESACIVCVDRETGRRKKNARITQKRKMKTLKADLNHQKASHSQQP